MKVPDQASHRATRFRFADSRMGERDTNRNQNTLARRLDERRVFDRTAQLVTAGETATQPMKDPFQNAEPPKRWASILFIIAFLIALHLIGDGFLPNINQ